MRAVTMHQHPSPLSAKSLDDPVIAAHWRRWAGLGAAGLALGGSTMGLALGPSVPTTTTLGVLLMVAALLEALHGLGLRHHAGSGWRLLGALIPATTGMVLLGLPLEGLLSANLVFGLFLLSAGLARSFLALILEPLRSWYWLFIVGNLVVALGLCFLLWAFEASLAAAAMVIGVTFALDGAWMLLTGWSARLRLGTTGAPQSS